MFKRIEFMAQSMRVCVAALIVAAILTTAAIWIYGHRLGGLAHHPLAHPMTDTWSHEGDRYAGNSKPTPPVGHEIGYG